MAYSPTTWNTNDVITKDRLNKMEQGIVSASKLSGTDIDTDKDWNGKNITNVGTILATNYNLDRMFVDVPGNTLRKQLDLNVSTSVGETWVPVASVAVPDNYHPSVNSNCRISVQVRYVASHTISFYIQFRAVVDGREIGTGSAEMYGLDSSPRTCTFNTSGGFVAGDRIDIEMWVDTPAQGTATVQRLTIMSTRDRDNLYPIPATFVEAGAW